MISREKIVPKAKYTCNYQAVSNFMNLF